MRRNLWVRNTEFALLLPATLVMAPLAAFAGLGTAFALVQQKFLTGIAMLLMLLMTFLGGILGLICVWVSLLIPAEKFVQRRLRIGIACGIAIGIADGLYWLATLRSEVGSFGPSSWSMWLLMLVGPIIVGMHQFFRLIRPHGAPAEVQSS